jgi:hypothetical protein
LANLACHHIVPSDAGHRDLRRVVLDESGIIGKRPGAIATKRRMLGTEDAPGFTQLSLLRC